MGFLTADGKPYKRRGTGWMLRYLLNFMLVILFLPVLAVCALMSVVCDYAAELTEDDD